MNFNSFLQCYQERVEHHLRVFLPSIDQAPVNLHRAMHYSTLNGGKRIRPLLIYAIAQLLKIPDESVDGPAIAAEMIHCYSLIHDDLPAMDDDDLRRGKPTCHKAFDEATAILAGDALQALAFEVLVNYPAKITDKQRLFLIRTLSQACGSHGMAGGQALDIEGTGQCFDLPYVANMHQKKTGALISASIDMAASLSNLESGKIDVLHQAGKIIGLAFQIQDDILDIEGNTLQLGKNQGADLAASKLAYPAVLGLDEAKSHLQKLHAEVIDLLNAHQLSNDILFDLIDMLTKRDY